MKILEPNINSIFKINSEEEFNKKALEIFRFQAKNNIIYKEFISLLSLNADNVKKVEEIPYLPISFFKSKKVLIHNSHQKIFKSSGTTGQVRSQHFVYSLQMYIDSFVNGINHFYSNFQDYTILALLPSYLEQGDSSLVYMVDYLINETKEKHSSFYLNNHEYLSNKIDELEQKNKKFILFGVSYALLDFKDKFPKNLESGIVMETGGMKGRRKEVTKKELHQELKNGFGTEEIHSEYGMTELLSQAYSLKKGIYKCPPWMKVLLRNTTDPFQISSNPSKGLINIIDLANVYSCSFIATDDIGKIENKNEFLVLGRFDASEVRGCNLMVD
jgi:phenylacetate-coenzyme A ligase PaaK-like adenylate-forming protein